VLEKAAKQQQQQNLSQECLTKYYLLDQNILHFLHTELHTHAIKKLKIKFLFLNSF